MIDRSFFPRELQLSSFPSKANDWRNREHVVLDLFSNLKWKDPRVSFGEPLKHVITLRGPFIHGKQKIGDKR